MFTLKSAREQRALLNFKISTFFYSQCCIRAFEPLHSRYPLASDQTLHLSWWGLWHSIHPGEPVPWSMVATCCRLSPWCLRHKHTSLRFFFSPQLPPSLARHATLHFWMQNLTDHMELQSIIFALLKIKRGFVYVNFSLPGSPFEKPLCEYCSMQSPPLFICLYECLLSSLLLRPHARGVHSCFRLRRWIISFLCIRPILVQLCVRVSLRSRLISPLQCILRIHAVSAFWAENTPGPNGVYKQPGYVWLL